MRRKTKSALRHRWVLILALCASALTARAGYDCDADYVNPWYDTNGLADNLTNAVVYSTVCYNGHSGPYALPGGFTPSLPTDGTYQLNRSSVGEPLAELVPDAAIGDVLAPPSGAMPNSAPVAISPPNAAFFVLSTGQVIAASHGSIVLRWVMTNGVFNDVPYDVSAVATRRPEKIFWTEAPYYSPTVSLNGKFARIHYNADVLPPVVTTNIVTSGGTNSVTNIVTDFSATVWIDDSNGSKSLRAQGCNGLFVLELFDTGSFTKQIGWEVVQVLAPDIIYQDVAIGQRLLPQDTSYGTGSLQAQITSDMNATGDATLYLHSSSSGKSLMEGWLYSVYQTVYDPWDAEVYWMNTGVAGIQWPIEKDQYLADWPVDCQVMTYAAGPTNSAPTLIPTALNPQLMSMEEPIRNFALNNGALTVQTNGYGLLKYTSQDENVWFQVVRSVAHDNASLYDLMPIPWDVATKVLPAVAQSALGLSELTSVNCGTEPTVLGRQPRTVELWASLHAGPGLPLFSMGTTNALGGFSLRPVSITASNVVVAMDVNGAATNVVLASSPGQWHHYAMTYDGLNLILYFDGGNVAAMTAVLETLPGPFIVGSTNTTGNTNYDRADVMEVRVWTEARTSEQLLGCMNQNLSFQDLLNTSLLAYFPLNFSGGLATLDFVSGQPAPITSPYGYVAATAPVTFGLEPWSHYPGFIYSGRSYNPDYYAYPMVTNNPNSSSAIFAVHTNSPLEIWWANRYQPAGLPAAIYWPSLVTRYQPQWPTNVPTLVLAHQTEAANALPDNADNVSIYYQNDFAQVGFNPNEEHALIFGSSVYAIRNDLNTATNADSSAPLVL
ncbi:MAG: LamG-like jellyroll fold domain-containing protein, partial [Verrucomicrobiota bacterium]